MQKIKWKADAFAWHQDRIDLGKYGYTQEELVALAWLMGIKREVVDRHFTWLCSISGRHRSGKSLFACTLGHIWDPTFLPNFEERVIYEPKQLLYVLTKLRHERTIGAVILIDEAGQSVSAMDWFEKWQKAISKATMILGYIYPIILFNAPIRDFINSPLRKMFHAHLEISRFNNEYTVIRPYEVKHSTTYKKPFWSKPKINFAGQHIVLSQIKATICPDFIRKRYENLEALEKDKLLDKFKEDIETSEVVETRQKLDPKAIVNNVLANYEIYQAKSSKQGRIILDARVIRFRFNIPADMAQYVKSEAERKMRATNENIKAEIEPAKDEPEERTKADMRRHARRRRG